MANLHLVEKILLRTTGLKKLTPGEFVYAKPDKIVTNDLYSAVTIPHLKAVGIEKIWDPNRVVVTIDHCAQVAIEPPMHNAMKELRDWVRSNGIEHFYELGRHGTACQIMVEHGHVRPGLLIAVDDDNSANCAALGAFVWGFGPTIFAVLALDRYFIQVPKSYNKLVVEGIPEEGVEPRDIGTYIVNDTRGKLKTTSLEVAGPTVDSMSIDGRMNLISKTGGIINPDKKTISYVKSRTSEPFDENIRSDPGAEYEQVLYYDASKVEPQVCPPPDATVSKAVTEFEKIAIDQGYIGSCHSGRMEDLRLAAKILRKRKVHKNTRLIIVPSSQEIYLNAVKEGLIEIFLQAGAVIEQPSCSACWGYAYLIGKGEVCLCTGTINYAGRMGSRESTIYLASASTVAASSVMGKITDPRELLQRWLL